MNNKKLFHKGFKNKKVLVTGGCGFIGYNLIKILKSYEAEIFCIDNLSANSNPIPKGAKFYKVDISSRNSLEKIFKSHKFNYIFHLAAHFANQNSIEHPNMDLRTNVSGTYNILDFAHRYAHSAKIFFASSSCVYGSGKNGYNEDSKLGLLTTPYSVHKMTAEKYCQMFCYLYNTGIVIGRYFNVFGPGEKAGKYRNVIPIFIKKILAGDTIDIYGDGDDIRSYTYIDDAVNITLYLILKGYKGEVYNICTDKNILSVKDLAEELFKLIKKPTQIKYLPNRNWDITKKRIGENEKITRLGFKGYSEVSFAEGLENTIKYIKTTVKK